MRYKKANAPESTSRGPAWAPYPRHGHSNVRKRFRLGERGFMRYLEIKRRRRDALEARDAAMEAGDAPE